MSTPLNFNKLGAAIWHDEKKHTWVIQNKQNRNHIDLPDNAYSVKRGTKDGIPFIIIDDRSTKTKEDVILFDNEKKYVNTRIKKDVGGPNLTPSPMPVTMVTEHHLLKSSIQNLLGLDKYVILEQTGFQGGK